MPRSGYRKKIYLEYDLAALDAVSKFRKSFPDLQAQLLGYIGKKGKIRLLNKYLRGGEGNITLTSPKRKFDKKGRRTVQYSIGKGAKHVSISSYPLNFFEKGRKLRSGAMEPGKYILTRKLKDSMSGDLQGMVDDFDHIYFKKFLDRMM